MSCFSQEVLYREELVALLETVKAQIRGEPLTHYTVLLGMTHLVSKLTRMIETAAPYPPPTTARDA